MAKVLDVPGLPPIGYSAFAEATSTIAGPHRPQVGILDCLLACISKALSVQVRAKGMLSNMLTAITKAAGSAVTIQSLSVAKKGVNREVPMETTVAPKRRWLTAGSMPAEVAMEVIKLIREMIEVRVCVYMCACVRVCTVCCVFMCVRVARGEKREKGRGGGERTSSALYTVCGDK